MHPILFRIPTWNGDIPVYSYGVMLAMSLIFAWYFIMRFGTKKENLNQELMANTFLVTAIAALVGARVLYILTNLDEFDTPGKWFQFRSGGLVAYGGFLGGFFGSWVYLRLKRVPLMPWADLVAPTLCSGLTLTRIGCWLYGCDFGRPLSKNAPAWLKELGTFPHWDFEDEGSGKFLCDQVISGSPAWTRHMHLGLISEHANESLPVHPTQIYESLAGVVLFAIALLVWRYRKFRGQVFLVVVALYSTWRFFVETVRDDPERGFFMGFSTSQVISLALLPLAFITYVWVQKRAQEKGEPSIPAYALQPVAIEPPASTSTPPYERKRRSKKRR